MTKKQVTTRTEHALKAPHTHGGKQLAAGDKVQLRLDQVERLRALKIID